MIIFSSQDVKTLLTMEAAIETVEQAMQEVADGKTNLPLRMIVDVGAGNKLGVMPGAFPESATFGVKLLSLYPNNPAKGLSSHIGAMVLFDPHTGAPSAMMSADALTAIRTAAASASATRALARPDAQSLALVGTGEQAESHLAAISLVREIRCVRIVGRSPDKAQSFVARVAPIYPDIQFAVCADVEEAVKDADIICTVTSTAKPVLQGRWLAAGSHVNAVGASIPSQQEIDQEVVRRALLFVDYRASALAQAKDIMDALAAGLITQDHLRGEIGEVTSGRIQGRTNPEDITLYRSLGVAAQDISCAQLVALEGQKRGFGTQASLL